MDEQEKEEEKEEEEERFSPKVFVRFFLEKTKRRLFRSGPARALLSLLLFLRPLSSPLPPPLRTEGETGPAVEIIYCRGAQGTPHTRKLDHHSCFKGQA